MRNIIEENSLRINNSFTYQLQEGVFDKGLFNEFAKYVYDINNDKSLSNEERLLISCKLWEISLFIMELIKCHKDKNDVYEMCGIEEEEEHSLADSIYILSNYMTYNKKFNFTDVFI